MIDAHIPTVLLGSLLAWSSAALGGGLGGLRPITDAETIVAIYTQGWEIGSEGAPRVIVVAWPDGEVLWSEDRLGGGPPYSIGHVSPERVRGVLDRAEEDGALDDVTLARPCFGPDTRYTTILFKRGRRQLRMASWHELAEAAGTLVARSCALTALSGERRLEVLRREPSEALYYRVVWGELRGLAVGLIPPAGGRAAGEVLLHGGTLAWQEESR